MATCRALGWRPGHVLWDVVSGSLLFGALAALVGIGLSFFLADWGELYVPWVRLAFIGVIAVAVYALGSLFPGIGAGRVHPMLAMAAGEAGGRTASVSRKGGQQQVRVGISVPGLALGAFLARWRRQMLTLLCLAVATFLLATFLLVTVRMRGVMCGSLLGDFLILEITPRHLLTAALCLGLALVAVTEIMTLNVAERRGELQLLSALGWRPRTIRLMIAWEGAFGGLAGGLLGAALAVALLATYQDVGVGGLILPALAVLPLPTLAGFIGALIPGLSAGGGPRGRLG